MPPSGCRGILAPWPQLIQALTTLEGYAETHIGNEISFGCAETLLSGLSAKPDLLHPSAPETDIYNKIVRLAANLSGFAGKVAATLNLLPNIALAHNVESEKAGLSVREVFTGKFGLIPLANDAIAKTSGILSPLQSNETIQKALKEDTQLSGHLNHLKEVLSEAPKINASELQGNIQDIKNKVSDRMRQLEISGKRMTVNAVTSNMIAALKNIHQGWVKTADNFNKIATETTPQDLANDAYWRDILKRDEAVSQWKALARITRNFVASSLQPSEKPSTNALSSHS